MYLSLNGQIRFHVVTLSFIVQKDVTSGVATRRLKGITTLHTSSLSCFYPVFYSEFNPLLKYHVCWIYAGLHSHPNLKKSDCSPNRLKNRKKKHLIWPHITCSWAKNYFPAIWTKLNSTLIILIKGFTLQYT